MKRFAALLLPILSLVIIYGFNISRSYESGTARNYAKINGWTVPPDTLTGSTAGFRLGVQMWTFKEFTFTDALDKVDSTGIKYIEAYIGQKLGGGMDSTFNFDMTGKTREELKKLLHKKGIRIVAMGVISPTTRQEWIKAFQLAREFGLSYVTAEPVKPLWDFADSLAGAYGILIAIHDHPRPNAYWSPDSVLAAMKGHPHFGSCADIGHWARNGLDPVECLRILQGHIIGVHLKDIVKFNDTKAADTVVGMGVIHLPAVLTELKRQNFKGMLSIEHESNWYHSLPDVIYEKNYYYNVLGSLKPKA
jgi:sugar phosphate isomerase/epimerase